MNPKKISKDINRDSISNKLIKIFEVRNNVKRKRGRPQKIIQEIKLPETIKRRGRHRKYMNKSLKNGEKRKFAKSEDKSDSDLDYDIQQRPKANRRKRI